MNSEYALLIKFLWVNTSDVILTPQEILVKNRKNKKVDDFYKYSD